MFSGHKDIWPGVKITMNPPIGGVEVAKRYKFTSKSEAEKTLRLNLFCDLLTNYTNTLPSFLWNFTEINNRIDSVIKKLNYPKFRSQNTIMTSFEQYNLSAAKYFWQAPYIGRHFEIKTIFINCKKEGEAYNVVYAPLTVSLNANTFLWNAGSWNYITEERKFDQSRAKDRSYINEVYQYLRKGTKMVDAPYDTYLTSENVEKIYQRLSEKVTEEREKFIELTK